MKAIFINLLRDDQGQDLIEYALLMAFLSIVVVGFAAGAKASLLGIATTAGAKLSSANTIAGS